MAAKTGAEPKAIVSEGSNGSVTFSGDGRTMVFTRATMTMPAEIFAAASDGSGARQLTHHNDGRLAALDLNPPEPFWFDGADGAKVQGMLVRPPHFDPAKKYPMLLLIHGGPQNMWANAWSYRWNPEVFAAPGYVAVMINPRGSTADGPRFTDELRDDWRGLGRQGVSGFDERRGLCGGAISVRGRHAHRRGGRVVRRLHGQLDGGAHRPFQSFHQPRGHLRQDGHVRLDRGTLVRGA